MPVKHFVMLPWCLIATSMRKLNFAFNILASFALQEKITNTRPLLCFEKIQVGQRIIRYIGIFWNHHFAVLIQYQSKKSQVQRAHFVYIYMKWPCCGPASATLKVEGLPLPPDVQQFYRWDTKFPCCWYCWPWLEIRVTKSYQLISLPILKNIKTNLVLPQQKQFSSCNLLNVT